jgi:hypothetical protein
MLNLFQHPTGYSNLQAPIEMPKYFVTSQFNNAPLSGFLSYRHKASVKPGAFRTAGS